MKFLKDIKKYKEYTLFLTKANIKAEANRYHLGWIWWFLSPICDVLVYFFLFCYLMNKSNLYPLAFIYSGRIMWRIYAHSSTNSISIINSNKSVLSKTYIPKYCLVLSNVLQNVFVVSIAYSLTFIILIFYRAPFTWHILEVLPLMLIYMVLTFGVSCIFMHIGVYIADFKKLMGSVTRLLMYVSGVLYSFTDILGPEKGKLFINCNPLAFLITTMRGCTVYGESCDWGIAGIWAAVSIVLSIFGIYLIYSHENNYLKVA